MKLLDYNVPRPLAYLGVFAATTVAFNLFSARQYIVTQEPPDDLTEPWGLVTLAGLILLETQTVMEGAARYEKALKDRRHSKKRQEAYWVAMEEQERNYVAPVLDESNLEQFINRLKLATVSKAKYEKEYDRVTRYFHGVSQPLKPETLGKLRVLGYPRDFEDLPQNAQKEAENGPSEETTKPTKTEAEKGFSRLVPCKSEELTDDPKETESITQQDLSPTYPSEPPRLTLVTSKSKPTFGGFESAEEAKSRYLRELPKPLSHFALNALRHLEKGKSTSLILREDLQRPGSAKCYEGDYLNDGKRIWEDLGLPIVVKGTEPYKPCDRSRKVRVHLEVPEKFKDSIVPARVQSSEDYLKTLEAA